jgi:hypothetical protein
MRLSATAARKARGWCKDRWGLSWQIIPRTLTDALAAGGAEATRAFEAMMSMKEDRHRHHRDGATRLMTPCRSLRATIRMLQACHACQLVTRR